MGAYHPESPQRLLAIDRHLRETGLLDALVPVTPQLVERACVRRVHPEAYLAAIDATAPKQGVAELDGDTAMNPHTLRAARLASGAVVGAVRAVVSGELTNAFCAVRPPGHHAERATAMGFCLYNNVAIGAMEALANETIERVAVLDFDVHHGNGTVDIFKDDERVLVCSSFQHPFYPMRYFDIERPNVVNTPLPAGTGSLDFRRSIERDWLPALQAHKPQVIFVSAGFDAHRDDPLGGLNLDDDDYAWVTRLITDAAKTYANTRVISTLEGGYDLDALARSVHMHLSVLADAA